MNSEAHAGILAAAPVSSLIPLLTFLVFLSRPASVSPTENCEDCRVGAVEAIVGWGLNFLAHSILFSLLPLSQGGVFIPAQPL